MGYSTAAEMTVWSAMQDANLRLLDQNDCDEQVTSWEGSAPSFVGCANKHEMVNSVAGGVPCCTVIVALVKARSVIVSVQFGFGQPGAPAIGLFGGGWVVTVKVTLPFLTSDAGIACEPETETGAGFCPGGCEFPDGLVQMALALAVAARFTRTSPAPSPANAPAAVSVRPLSVKDGLLFGGFRHCRRGLLLPRSTIQQEEFRSFL
jgi:hypothetical protein